MAADPKRAKRLDKALVPPAVTTEYVNAIGMMFSLAALLLRVSGTDSCIKATETPSHIQSYLSFWSLPNKTCGQVNNQGFRTMQKLYCDEYLGCYLIHIRA